MLFRPTFRAKSSESILVNFSQFSLVFSRFLVSIFPSIFPYFSRFQSISVNFSQFQPGHTRQKRRNILPTGRWGETTPKERQENGVQILKNDGGSQILWPRAPCYFMYGRVLWVALLGCSQMSGRF